MVEDIVRELKARLNPIQEWAPRSETPEVFLTRKQSRLRRWADPLGCADQAGAGRSLGISTANQNLRASGLRASQHCRK